MLKRILGYSLLAAFAYICFLIIELPADVAWRYLQPYVAAQQIPVQVSSVQGTVWQGSGLLSYQGQSGRLEWRLRPWQQLLGKPVLNVDLVTDAGRLNGLADVSWSGVVAVRVQGQVGLDYFNPLLARDRIVLAGTVRTRDLAVQWDPLRQELLDADGVLQWTGGTIGYPVAGRIQQQQMPPLSGVVSHQNQNLALNVREQVQGPNIIEVTVQPDGLARVAVRRRLLDLAGAPWSQNSGPQDVVFRVQQKLF